MASALTIREVSEAIVALINSRASSPRLEEVEAIIGKTMGNAFFPSSARLAQLLEEIPKLEAANEAAGRAMTDTECDAMALRYKPLDALTEAVWATPVRTLADLKERALIARHWFSADDGSPWEVPADIDDWGDQAVGHLIHAVLEFDGALPLADRQGDTLAHWDKRVRQFLEATKGDCDCSDYDRLKDELVAACEEQWAKPVRSLSDLLPLLLIATHWNSPAIVGEPAYPYDIIAKGKEGSMDDRALAFLVRGLLDLTRLRFDPDGRLLSKGASPPS